MEFELTQPDDDGLYIPDRDVGVWTRDKHHFLQRYLHAFTIAMRKKRWDSLHYIDLFASAGVARVAGYGLDWGSPLIAAQVPDGFTKLHLCEKDERAFSALTERIKKFPQPTEPQLLMGDANELVCQIVSDIPRRALSVAFLDPYGLHLNFETLKMLAQRPTDLIIFWPDHVDALRNWEKVYAGKADSNLDQVLGGVPWLERMTSRPRDYWAEALTNIYKEQIKALGYGHFEQERISRTDGHFLYKLIFCCRDKAGAKIWRGISRKDRGGQLRMDW